MALKRTFEDVELNLVPDLDWVSPLSKRARYELPCLKRARDDDDDDDESYSEHRARQRRRLNQGLKRKASASMDMDRDDDELHLAKRPCHGLASDHGELTSTDAAADSMNDLVERLACYVRYMTLNASLGELHRETMHQRGQLVEPLQN